MATEAYRQAIDTCVHCGFCLPACPTYLLWREEMDSPRGRIHLMKALHEGRLPLSEEVVTHFDRCLGCVACMTACPSGVDYGTLIVETRFRVEREHSRTLGERLYRRLLFNLFTRPKRLRVLMLPLLVYQRTGLQGLVRRSGILGLLPPRLRALEELLPAIRPAGPVAPKTPAVGERRARVALLLGCVQRVFFPGVNAATARVLAAEGCEVLCPGTQPCCGALYVHAGEEEDARASARATIDAFEGLGVDAIIVNAAGCGSNLKEYGHLLKDDPEYAARAAALSQKCRDVAEFLAALPPRAPRQPLPLSVAYQDACHLQHAQKVAAAPRSLLAGIPGLEVQPLPEAGVCCGSAGIYNLIEPQAGADLGARKAAHVAAVAPEALVSGNPGCLLQIGAALRREGRAVASLHTIEVLDASIRGASREELLRR
jgi:glycolate oxidase iron-sulfur subunit